MVTLTIADTEPVEMSVSEDPAPSFNAGLTTVVTENNYNDLRNKPSIEGAELTGNKTLNDLNGYTQTQIDTKLSAKANRSEIPSLNGYATEAWVESQNYASEDDFYTKGQTDNLLADKADKSEIPSLNGYATQQWVTDKHYLTEHQSLAGYATEQWVENKGYLTQHQSLANYYTKGQTNDLLDAKADTSDIPTKTSELTNDSGYITDAGVTSFNGNTGAVTYTAPVSSVNGRTGAVTVSVPSKTSDLTNDSGYITLADLPIYSGGVS